MAYSFYSPPPLQVSYSGVVHWTSNDGVFLQFPESGHLTTTKTNITISPLTPSTHYTLKISVVTTEGEGAKIIKEAGTRRGVGGREMTYRRTSPANDTTCSQLRGFSLLRREGPD